ncbi:MAG: hypothetical protein JWL97_4073 [Gemmatimonadales bacterium]|nr:hypothetical protein [Gemmatimonadales bacterium]
MTHKDNDAGSGIGPSKGVRGGPISSSKQGRERPTETFRPAKRSEPPKPDEAADLLVERIVESVRKVATAGRGVGIQPERMEDLLRQVITAALTSTDVHRARLAEIDRLAVNANNIGSLQKGIAAYLRQAGIERIVDTNEISLFRVVPGGSGDFLEVLQPAYRDRETGSMILSGQVRRVEEQQDVRVRRDGDPRSGT